VGVPGEQSDAATREKQKLELAKTLLRAGSTIRIRAFGTSMLPTIWPGDVLVIESASLDRLECGDVVLVNRENGVRVHRLLDKQGAHWITRGDGMAQDDPPMEPDQILGRVLEIRRRKRVLVPRRQVQLVDRLQIWLLSRSQTCCKIALLAHSVFHGGSHVSVANPHQPTNPIASL
jgi:Peptidase S24-like